MAAMMNNLRNLLDEFIADTDAEFDRLMVDCKKPDYSLVNLVKLYFF